MNRFWDIIIEPLLKIINAKTIVEVGAQRGLNTVNLLEYCKQNEGILHTVDPVPMFDYESMEKENGGHFKFYKELSLSALPKMSDYEAILIDGDHNWYTVYHELEIIGRQFKDDKFPVVFLHDIGWPYGRRDLYYNPENIPDYYRQPHKKLGLLPGNVNLVEKGLNPHLEHAIYENNPRNGVLTAVEDFIQHTNHGLSLFRVQAFFGLGILCPKHLEADIQQFLTDLHVQELLITRMEEERIDQLIKIEELKRTYQEKKAQVEKLYIETKDLKEQTVLKEEMDTVLAEMESLLEKIDFLSRDKQELLSQINVIANEKEALTKQLNKASLENDTQIKQLQLENKSLKSKNIKLTQAVQKSKRKIKETKASFRYQFGEIFASAAKPSINTLKFPVRLLKLFFRTLKRKFKGTNQNEKRNTQMDIKKSEKRAIKAIPQSFPNIVDIVIPVYNALDELKECVASLQKYTKFPHRIILINDKSPDPNVSVYLQSISINENIIVLENEQNLGFIGSINRGFEYSSNDVVILNSDTRVTSEWLRSLVVCAYSMKEIGTVTPVSNAAGPFSVPKFNENLDLKAGYTEHDYAKMIAKYSERNYPEVPTGNGYCMYIKRVVIDQVGNFDTAFGKGYCEENDFCMRVLKSGMTNVIDDSTFVYHQRTVSFSSEEKQKLIQENRRILDEKHPEYTELVRKFIAENPLSYLQEKMQEEFEGKSEQTFKRNSLFVLHKGSGGTPLTNLDLLRNIRDTYQPFVLTSDRKELELYKLENNGDLKLIFKIAFLKEISVKDFSRFDYKHILTNIIHKFDISKIHVRHLLGHTFDIPTIAKEMNIPIVLSFHDFYFICPTIQLLDDKKTYCAGACTQGQGKCHYPKGWFPDMPDLKHNWIYQWREEAGKMFANVDVFITTSEYSKERYCTVYPDLREKPFHVIEHGRDFELTLDVAVPPERDKKIKIVSFGGLNLQKGSKLLIGLMELDKKRENRIELHLLGKVADKKLEEVAISHGEYERDELPILLEGIRPNLSAVFSIWPETYCHTLTESWALGLPTLVTDIGTLRERVVKSDAGWLVDVNNIEEIYNKILYIADDPDEYHRVKEKVDQLRFPSTLEMSKQYAEVYRDLCGLKVFS
ncbi:hypothetical protein BKP37_14755 [Anaerobacillus alkalilacustris]|uniref:Glycosyltransferase 2-like domain-containing protein n=1 Tax=Anaerobacillus alkalilacustris TaxID=393763 RepID=A0A1S2LGP9_9BACI|nr:glycosyltransferase [Anaerobacillus alkalilacustris]OIJ11702.1 hypothetical protein BKP37_14755 [Anaerobacillus alkalilacustris]